MKFIEYCKTQSRWGSAIIQFFLLFGFWLILSGKYETQYVVLGAISSALITRLTCDYFYSVFHQESTTESDLKGMLAQIWRFIKFIPWLVWQIIVANFQVAYYVLHPKMPIDPELLTFKTEMKKGISKVTLANAITLTPGTITARLVNSRYIVHTLKRSLAGQLENGTMQQKVGKVFDEKKEEAPGTYWVRSTKDIDYWLR